MSGRLYRVSPKKRSYGSDLSPWFIYTMFEFSDVKARYFWSKKKLVLS